MLTESQQDTSKREDLLIDISPYFSNLLDSSQFQLVSDFLCLGPSHIFSSMFNKFEQLGRLKI